MSPRFLMGEEEANKALADTLHYKLYDLRESKAIGKIHLPTPEEGGVVLLMVNERDYIELYQQLVDLCFYEGAEWMTAKITRAQEQSAESTSDLIPLANYILIAHMNLVKEDTYDFLRRLTHLQEWLPN